MNLRACNAAKAGAVFPDEIIFQILSYLPLKSLYRFKCVCKLWSTLFLNPTFLYLYQKHCPIAHVCSEDANILRQMEFANCNRWKSRSIICRSSHNLTLDKRETTYPPTRVYYIESEQLREELPIPNPRCHSLCIALEFVTIKSNPCGGFIKLISVHQDGRNNFGYEVLSIDFGGTQKNPCRWRAIDKVPPSEGGKRRKLSRWQAIEEAPPPNIQLLFRMGVAYCIWFVKTDGDDDIHVDVVDMVNETYIGHTTFPRSTFLSKLTMSTTHILDWNGRLSFAQLLNDQLHVLVLDDHTKLKWAETKRVIKLHFLKSYHKDDLITFHACADKSTLLFLWQRHNDTDTDSRSFCYYDIYTGEFSTRKVSASISNSNREAAELVALVVAKIAFRKAGL